jgi:hypothetical protein
MTRKHFELIAATVQSLLVSDEEKIYIATQFANVLATQNPRFDRSRFIRAAASPSDQRVPVAA